MSLNDNVIWRQSNTAKYISTLSNAQSVSYIAFFDTNMCNLYAWLKCRAVMCGRKGPVGCHFASPSGYGGRAAAAGSPKKRTHVLTTCRGTSGLLRVAYKLVPQHWPHLLWPQTCPSWKLLPHPPSWIYMYQSHWPILYIGLLFVCRIFYFCKKKLLASQIIINNTVSLNVFKGDCHSAAKSLFCSVLPKQKKEG